MNRELTITDLARMGGKARAAKLSKERRSEIAAIAGSAPKKKRKKRLLPR